MRKRTWIVAWMVAWAGGLAQHVLIGPVNPDGDHWNVKHLIILSAAMILGMVWATVHPFWGILLYYALAVLRPQYLWEWALPVQWRWSAIAAVIAVVGILLALPRVLRNARVGLMTWAMLAFGLLVALSTLTAHDPVTAAAWAEEYAKVLIMAVLASLVIDQLSHVRAAAVMILAVLGYIAWEMNYLYFVNQRLDIFHYGYGGMDNNGAGLLLAMGVPVAAAFAIGGSRLWERALAAMAGLLMMHAVMLSHSRGAMLAGILGVAWFLLRCRQRTQAALASVALAIAIAVLAGPSIQERFLSTRDYQTDDSAQSRIESWRAAWAIAWDNPVLGTGVRNSNLYSSNYGADRVGRTIHNQVLQVAADSGIPAMLLYLAILGGAVYAFDWAHRRCAQVEERSLAHDPRPGLYPLRYSQIILGLQSSLIIFVIGSAFLSLEVFELPWMLIVIAGCLPAVLERHGAPASDRRNRRRAAARSAAPQTSRPGSHAAPPAAPPVVRAA